MSVWMFFMKYHCIFFLTPSLLSLGELVTTPLFDGEESYIAYPPLTNIHDDLRVELEFKPLERDGLMFFCGGKKMKVEDFVAISMVEGHVEFRYELGTGKESNLLLFQKALNAFYIQQYEVNFLLFFYFQARQSFSVQSLSPWASGTRLLPSVTREPAT